MELTRQRLIMIIAAAIAIIAIGLYIFLYGPLIRRLRVMHIECKTIEADALQTRNRIAAVKTIDIKKGLIKEEEISLAINELTKQGKLEGINFVSMAPKEIEKREDAPYNILPIEMEIESTYEHLGIFLGSLDELERCLVAVRSFNVVPDKEEPAKLKTKLTVNMCLCKHAE